MWNLIHSLLTIQLMLSYVCHHNYMQTTNTCKLFSFVGLYLPPWNIIPGNSSSVLAHFSQLGDLRFCFHKRAINIFFMLLIITLLLFSIILLISFNKQDQPSLSYLQEGGGSKKLFFF